MTPPATVAPGLPVAVGEIERQLGLLWEQSDAGKVRASLVNLVVYSEAPDAIAANTPLLASIAADHAFRALLVQGDPAATRSDVRAWITAHCHLRDAGKSEICSEQITFQLDGQAAGMLPNIVFAHLDTDLPLYLWWQGELPSEPDPQLWTRVDRLIIDSVTWPDPAAQFGRLREIEAFSRGRCAVSDLAWTRLFALRYALAALLDLPGALAMIARPGRVVIRHADGQRQTALELLGWLASRLGWNLDGESRSFFRQRDHGRVDFELQTDTDAAESVSSVLLEFGGGRGSIRRSTAGDFYLLEASAPGQQNVAQMLPAGREKLADILVSELSRNSLHPLFWPAVAAVEPLMARR